MPRGNLVTFNATIPIVIGRCIRPAAKPLRGTRSTSGSYFYWRT